MSPELSRTIAIIAAVFSIAALLFAVRSSRRRSRVRTPLEIALLTVSLGVIPTAAAITGVHTHPALALGAVAAGTAFGLIQGAHVELHHEGGKLYARRSVTALAAWVLGIAVVQFAGAADRAGVVETGQALSYFGVSMSFGLLVGRQGSINRLGPSTAALFLAGACAVLTLSAFPYGNATAQANPTPTPAPKFYQLEGTFDLSTTLDAFTSPGGDVSIVGGVGSNELTLQFSEAGGPVSGEGSVSLTDFHVGMLVAILQGVASGIGEAVGGAIGGAAQSGGAILGGGPGAGGNQATSTVAIPAELQNCKGVFRTTFTMAGTYDPVSKRLSGTYGSSGTITDLKGCPASLGTAVPFGETATNKAWEGTFDGKAVAGRLKGEGEKMPFTAREKDARTPVASAPPAASGSTAAGSSPGSRPDPEPGDDPLIAPPIGIEEIKDIEPGEAAGAAVVGLAGVVVVVGSVAATAQTGTAAAGTAGGAPATPGIEEIPPMQEPPKPQPIIGENVLEAGEKLATGFERSGYEGLAASIDARVADGSLTPEEAEHLRERLRGWRERDEALANSDLMTRSDVQAFADGVQEDAAWLAEKLGQPGIAALIRNPLMAARIAAAIASGGSSEVIITPLDVMNTVQKEVSRPGASLSDSDVAGMIAKETAWQVGADVVGDKLAAGLGGRLGGQVDDAAGAGLGRSGLDEAAEAGSRRVGPGDVGSPTPGSLDDGLRSAADGAPTVSPPPRGPALEPSTALKDAPQGTQIPRDRIREAGFLPEQLDDMQRIAKEHNAVIGSRTVNPDSLPKLENGTSIPKPPDIKAKTASELDSYLGIDPGSKGEVVLFEPKKPPFPEPGASGSTDPLHQKAWDRYNERAAEVGKLREPIEALEQQGLVKWDRQTGLITNTGLNPDPATFGKTFAGDIDGVYARDATTGEFLTGDRAAKLFGDLQQSRVQSQHRWETNAVNDIVAKNGEDALSGAVDLHRKLEGGHLSGKEITVEVGPDHVQVGPSNINDADHGLGPDWLHTGGTPIVVDEDLLP